MSRCIKDEEWWQVNRSLSLSAALSIFGYWPDPSLFDVRWCSINTSNDYHPDTQEIDGRLAKCQHSHARSVDLEDLSRRWNDKLKQTRLTLKELGLGLWWPELTRFYAFETIICPNIWQLLAFQIVTYVIVVVWYKFSGTFCYLRQFAYWENFCTLL